MKRNAIIALIIAAIITYQIFGTIAYRIAGALTIWFPIFMLLVGTEKES